MAHFHEDSDTYYLDQLCLVFLSGAFGAICLSLYFWQRPMLNLMLGEQFHGFVLASGFLLFGMALIRGGILWKSAGETQDHSHDHSYEHAHESPEHAHDHDHDHNHEHDHGHEHEPGTGTHSHEPGHTHEHPHIHAHDHHHDHAHGHHDHDHDWAPWRYVVLLVPIILFFLGLPNKGPKARATTTQVDMTAEAISYAALVAKGTDPRHLLGGAALTLDPSSGPIAGRLNLKEVDEISSTPELRKEWKGKRVQVRGQFAPSPQSDHVFSLVRFRIRCCAADAIQVSVPVVSKENLHGLKADWVDVTGTIDFQPRGNSFITLLKIPGRKAIEPSVPESNPWLQ